MIHVKGKPIAPPSRKTIRSRLAQISEAAKSSRKTELAANDSKVSLALDCWSSRTGHAFIGITCHWVDVQFQLHEALLEFKKLKGAHTGANLAEAVYNTLEEFDLSEKLFCIHQEKLTLLFEMLSLK